MEKQFIIAAIIYFLGFLISRKMLMIEHEASKEELKKGEEILLNILSMLSFLVILFMLINAWISKIKLTGYWNKPAKDKAK